MRAPVLSPSSTRVFHSPQASHLPCQRLNAAPQFWQTKVRLRLDMGIAANWPFARLGWPGEQYKNNF